MLTQIITFFVFLKKKQNPADKRGKIYREILDFLFQRKKIKTKLNQRRTERFFAL